jgi:hypothetical protein
MAAKNEDRCTVLLKKFGVDMEAFQAKQDERWARTDKSFIRHARVRLVPDPWKTLQLNEDGGYYGDGTLRVMTSVAREDDEKHWLHVSVVREDGTLPTYADLCRVKALFIGSYRQAIHVFPKSAEHVNLHQGCLHLFACLEDERCGLPDFTSGLGTI